MTCEHLSGGITICRGPATEPRKTGITESAKHCPKCKRRRVLELVAHRPIEPSYYGPYFTWDCECGGSKPAPGWDIG